MSFDEEVISVYIYQLSESYFNGIMVHCLSLLKMLRAIVSIWRKVSMRGCLLCCVSIAPIKQILLGHVLWDFLVILNIQQLTQVAILLLSGLNTILWPKHYELTWHPDLLDCTTSLMNSTYKDSFQQREMYIFKDARVGELKLKFTQHSLKINARCSCVCFCSRNFCLMS